MEKLGQLEKFPTVYDAFRHVLGNVWGLIADQQQPDAGGGALINYQWPDTSGESPVWLTCTAREYADHIRRQTPEGELFTRHHYSRSLESDSTRLDGQAEIDHLLSWIVPEDGDLTPITDRIRSITVKDYVNDLASYAEMHVARVRTDDGVERPIGYSALRRVATTG